MPFASRFLSGLLFFAGTLGSLAAADGPAGAADRAARDAFAAARFERTEAPPFAFLYGGRSSASFLAHWRIEGDPKAAPAAVPSEAIVKTVSYKDPATGLRAILTSIVYRDFPAVEWVVRLRNEGPADTPLIQDLMACDVSLAEFGAGPVTLYRALGSSADRSDFAPVRDTLSAPGAAAKFSPSGGRSSDSAALPFFNVAAEGKGIVAGIGWSGKWRAAVEKTGARGLRLTAGMDATRFRLHPGEEVRTASIALLFWTSGERLDGHNLWRRFVLAHHTPRPHGVPVELPLSSGVAFGGPFPCNEYVCATEAGALAAIDRLKQFGLDMDNYWIDAGWYENATKNWWSGVGNWTINKANFPRGFKPVTDAAKALGKGFVLWFEPERVYEGTRLDREHPDWLVSLPGNPNRLLNLGDKRALAWLSDYVAGFLKAEGVSVYRQDFNFDPAPYWKAMDAPDRIGIAEMKHVEGLYAYWDALLARVPGLLIDNCASGGRRIDLETIGRSVPLWRTDYSYFEPNGYQCHTYGLHLFLPASGTGNNATRKYEFRSSMNGAVVTGWEINNAFNVTQAVEDIAEFRVLRPYFYGDFYPLTEYSTSDGAWSAMQWDRPAEREGIVLAFRRPMAMNASITISPKGIDPAGDYEVSFEDYGIAVVKAGKELAGGLAIKIADAPGSLLIRYRRVR
jgi:alpha-galactosidase